MTAIITIIVKSIKNAESSPKMKTRLLVIGLGLEIVRLPFRKNKVDARSGIRNWYWQLTILIQ
jgi:hypothetical protein